MSTKGTSLAKTTKEKIALKKRKYSKSDLIKLSIEYLDKILNSDKDPKPLPSLTGLALHLNISKNTLNKYIDIHDEFSQYVDYILTYQEENLIQRASSDSINTGFVQFMLKSQYGYSDKPQSLTQNNYLNIQPEVVKEALKLMDKND